MLEHYLAVAVYGNEKAPKAPNVTLLLGRWTVLSTVDRTVPTLCFVQDFGETIGARSYNDPPAVSRRPWRRTAILRMRQCGTCNDVAVWMIKRTAQIKKEQKKSSNFTTKRGWLTAVYRS
jgi:hypothetical protein